MPLDNYAKRYRNGLIVLQDGGKWEGWGGDNENPPHITLQEWNEDGNEE